MRLSAGQGFLFRFGGGDRKLLLQFATLSLFGQCVYHERMRSLPGATGQPVNPSFQFIGQFQAGGGHLVSTSLEVVKTYYQAPSASSLV